MFVFATHTKQMAFVVPTDLTIGKGKNETIETTGTLVHQFTYSQASNQCDLTFRSLLLHPLYRGAGHRLSHTFRLHAKTRCKHLGQYYQIGIDQIQQRVGMFQIGSTVFPLTIHL